MAHSWTSRQVVAHLRPLPPREIRQWLYDQRRQGHVAHPLTPLATIELAVFSNVRLSALPLSITRPITYVFADATIALLFKLTFSGMFSG